MINVENLRAVNGGKAVEIDYLGSLLWSTVSDVLKIPTEDLKQTLTELDLERFMPRKINPRDAFHRVTKSFEVRRQPFGKDKFINLLVRDVRSEGGESIRQIVREVVDGKNVRLEYKPVLQLEIAEGQNLTITPLIATPLLSPEEQAVIEALPERHEEACHYYDGVHIRYMFHTILNACRPVSVRSNGGVIFIPHQYNTTVDAAKELAKRLNNYQGRVRLWSIPVIDAAEHREMIEESLEEQVLGGSDALIQEMKTLLSTPSRTVTTRLAQGYADRIRKVKEMVSEYEEMLDHQATKAHANLEIALQLAVKLMEATDNEAK